MSCTKAAQETGNPFEGQAAEVRVQVADTGCLSPGQVCALLPGSGSDHSTTGTVNYKQKLLCLFLHDSVVLKSSPVPHCHPCEPSATTNQPHL